MMQTDSKILVAGARGLVGSAIVRRLKSAGYVAVLAPLRAELDLMDAAAVDRYFERNRPEYIFDGAAKVGGIWANNTFPAEFIRNNLQIQINLIDAAYRFGTTKFLFLGSSCIYPKMAPQPMTEDDLLSGYLEPTNQPYAIAKIAGIEMLRSYRRQYGFRGISLMPTNLYGPNDNFDLKTSHVLPALIRKFHEAKVAEAPTVTVWGTGTPRREFLHVDDLADASVHLMNHYEGESHINVGVGEDISIAEVAGLVKKVTGYPGEIVYDTSKPDGPPRKLLNVTRLAAAGWQARIGLEEGLADAYRFFLDHVASAPPR